MGIQTGNQALRVGEIIEHLITIKDAHRRELTSDEIISINDACNILEHRFLKYDTSEELVDKTFASILWKHDDIRKALEDKGFPPTDENVEKVLEDLCLQKDIESNGIEAGWDVIYSRIYDIGASGFNAPERK